MAPKLPAALLTPPRSSRQAARVRPRLYSTSPEGHPPPFIDKIKADIKPALRAGDRVRLSLLRGVMAVYLNASKTSTPIKTDVQAVGAVRKMRKSIQEQIAEAKAASREDLVEKGDQEMRILDEYLAASGVQSLGEPELKALVHEAIAASRSANTAAKSLMGDVMKRLAGPLEGKDVDRNQVASLVKELAGQ